MSRLGTLQRCSVPSAGGCVCLAPSCTSWESWKVSPVSAPRRGEAAEPQPQAAVPEKNVGKLMVVNRNVSESLTVG